LPTQSIITLRRLGIGAFKSNLDIGGLTFKIESGDGVGSLVGVSPEFAITNPAMEAARRLISSSCTPVCWQRTAVPLMLKA
jgi:hypothetical protein